MSAVVWPRQVPLGSDALVLYATTAAVVAISLEGAGGAPGSSSFMINASDTAHHSDNVNGATSILLGQHTRPRVMTVTILHLVATTLILTSSVEGVNLAYTRRPL